MRGLVKWTGLAFLIAIAFFALAGTAQATDPKCFWTPTFVVDPDPLPDGDLVIYEPVDVIDATGPPPDDALPPGAFHYCVPTWDENGLNYPPAGYPMACEVRIGDQVLDRQEGLAPGQLVPVVGLTIRWDVDEIQIACANEVGEGVAFARPAIFPASRPGSPFVPSD